MKKTLILCAGMCVALAFTSCKSSESAYRKAYEKAKAQEQTQTQETTTAVAETPVVTPIQERPATETSTTAVDNATVRSEAVTVVSGSGLNAFSVVVGSFSLKANAEGLQNTLKSQGHDAQIVRNESINMYRVVASTFDNKADAVNSRNSFRAGNYPDAWLLFKK